MRITILGAGHVGGALGANWARHGHTIAYGVPNPLDPKHAPVANAAGHAKLAGVRDAVRDAEIIVLAVPWTAAESAIAECDDLFGRVVIDATNPIRPDKAGGLELALGFDTSAGEKVAQLARGASVFKTLNQVGFEVMADPSAYVAAPAMFVAGDDVTKKPIVLSLVRDLGFDAIDAGPLRTARLIEPYAMLWIEQMLARGMPRTNAFALLKKGT